MSKYVEDLNMIDNFTENLNSQFQLNNECNSQLTEVINEDTVDSTVEENVEINSLETSTESSRNVKEDDETIEFDIKDILFNENLDYPQEFPHMTIQIGGFILNESDLKTFKPYKDDDQFLNDNIMIAFFSLLPPDAETIAFKILTFDTHFMEKLRENGEASYMFKWATNNLAWNHDL